MDVIGVGGINFEEEVARFSSRGMTTWVGGEDPAIKLKGLPCSNVLYTGTCIRTYVLNV